MKDRIEEIVRSGCHENTKIRCGARRTARRRILRRETKKELRHRDFRCSNERKKVSDEAKTEMLNMPVWRMGTKRNPKMLLNKDERRALAFVFSTERNAPKSTNGTLNS